MWDKYGKLSVAIIVYYVLALPVAVWICIRHGFGRHAGWFYLLSLAIVRIVGAALRIAADLHPSKGVFIGAEVLSAIGLAPLLLSLLGLIKRVYATPFSITINVLTCRSNDGKEFGSVRVPPRAFQLAHVVTLIGLIMAVVAGADSSSSNPNDLKNVKTYRKASAILLLVSLLLSACMVVFLASRARKVIAGDRVIVHSILIALPFLFVRVAYTMLNAFDTSVNPLYPNIWEEAFMQILMEMVAYTLFLHAGVRAPKSNPADHPYGQGLELGRGKAAPGYPDGGQEQGYVGGSRR
jgi:hypothetical protein